MNLHVVLLKCNATFSQFHLSVLSDPLGQMYGAVWLEKSYLDTTMP